MTAATAGTAPNQSEIMADGIELYDWDGNEVDQLDQSYIDYVNSQPPKEDLRRFRKPIHYWEVRYPGCSLQPFPSMGAFNSTDTGLWSAFNKAQKDAIERHIQSTTGVDPEELKLSDQDLKVMNGRAKGPIRFCQDCLFVSSSFVAVDLHENLNGHTTKAEPRKDRE